MIKNSYIIEKITTETIKNAMKENKNIPRIRTSNTIASGITKLGNYIKLWKDNYEILKNIIPLNDIYCIV